MMKPLPELLAEASALIVTISEHPDYRSLTKAGHYPSVTLADAHTAIGYILFAVDPPFIDFPDIEE